MYWLELTSGHTFGIMAEKSGVVTMTNEEKILEMLTGMQAEIKEMKGEIKEMKGEIKEVKGEIKEVKGEIKEIKTEMEETKAELKEVHEKVDVLAESQEELRTSVNAILDWTDTVSTVVPIVPKIS